MSDLNVVALTGRLTRDPELRQTQTGTALARIRIASSRRVKRGDEWNDEPMYVDVIMFGARAEGLSNFLRKGDRISVNGELTYSEWEDSHGGGKRSRHEIVAADIQMLSRPSGSDRNDNPVDLGGGLTGTVIGTTPPPDLNEEIPF